MVTNKMIKYDSIKMEYLDLRVRLSKVNGYIDGVTDCSIKTKSMNEIVNGEPLFDVLKKHYKQRAVLANKIERIELENVNHIEWLT